MLLPIIGFDDLLMSLHKKSTLAIGTSLNPEIIPIPSQINPGMEIRPNEIFMKLKLAYESKEQMCQH